MLQFRRVLAFSSRIHTYLLALYLFFSLMFFFTFVTDVPEVLINFIHTAMTLISWTMIFFGVWIILASVYQFFYTKVFAFTPAVLTVIRTSLVITLAAVFDLAESLVSKGVSL